MKAFATSDNRPGIRLSLRAGEKIYINGAVLKADRKVSLELLNDATFLLENHVLQADQTTTPLRQLYFAVQMILIDPALGDKARETAHVMLKRLFLAFSDPDVLTGLKNVDIALHEARFFEALKIIRGLYALEAELLPVKSEADAAHEATLKGALA